MHALLRALVRSHRSKFCLNELNSPLPDTYEQPTASQHSQEKIRKKWVFSSKV